jgi:hypothetical protein
VFVTVAAGLRRVPSGFVTAMTRVGVLTGVPRSLRTTVDRVILSPMS